MFEKVFLVGLLAGGRSGHSGLSLPCLPVTLEGWSHPAFAAVPGGLPLVDGPQIVPTRHGDGGVSFTAFQETAWGMKGWFSRFHPQQ